MPEMSDREMQQLKLLLERSKLAGQQNKVQQMALGSAISEREMKLQAIDNMNAQRMNQSIQGMNTAPAPLPQATPAQSIQGMPTQPIPMNATGAAMSPAELEMIRKEIAKRQALEAASKAGLLGPPRLGIR
jgi:hypothetical protein